MQHRFLYKGHFQISQNNLQAFLNKWIPLRHFNTFDVLSLLYIVQIPWAVWLKKVTKRLDELVVLYHEAFFALIKSPSSET